MLLKVGLLLSMLLQLAAAITAVSLIKRTRFNISWILISAGFVLMALRRLFEFSTLFWETQLISKDEVNNWIGILISILMLTGVIFIRQIFNLQEQLEKLRNGNEISLLNAIIKTEEKTRQTIAKDLHDGLGPVLSSIKMTISAVDNQTISSSNHEMIVRAQKAADEAIVTLKEISNHLSPHLLKNYGLISAVNNLSQQLLRHTNIQFDLEENLGQKRYNSNLEINLFRVLSELIHNSIKHGHPEKIKLLLTEEKGSIQLKYFDNGKGFKVHEKAQRSAPEGMGLENIRSRVKSLNGNCFIQSETGCGTKIYIQIPLK